MKIHRYFLSLILVVLLIVSCSDTGLIKALMSSEYTEEIKIMNIVGFGLSSDNKVDKFYVATDKGIYSLLSNGDFVYVALDGEDAKNVLFYYDEKSLIYNGDRTYTFNTTDESVINKNFGVDLLKDYEFIEAYSPNGLDFSYILRKDSEYYFTRYTAASGSFTAISGPFSNLKIIGLDAYKSYKDGKYYYYFGSDKPDTVNLPDVNLYGLNFNYELNLYISAGADGSIYCDKAKVKPSYSTPTDNRIIPISTDGLLIFPNSDYFYKPTADSSNAERADSRLGSVQPKTIIEGTDGKYLIITAQNGAYILSGKSLKTLKEYGLTDFSNFIPIRIV